MAALNRSHEQSKPEHPFSDFMQFMMRWKEVDEPTLALRIGVRRGTLQRWLLGTTRPKTIGQINRLAEFAGLPGRSVMRVAWLPWDAPSGRETEDPLRDACLGVVYNTLWERVQVLPEDQRKPAFLDYLDQLGRRLESWAPAFRDPAPPTWRDRVAALCRGAADARSGTRGRVSRRLCNGAHSRGL